jgi:hypothetical protein
VAGDRRLAQLLGFAQLGDAQHLGLVAHLRLDGIQPDQRIQLGEQLVEGPGRRRLGLGRRLQRGT